MALARNDEETTPLLPRNPKNLKSKLQDQVDAKDCIPILTLMIFITGFLDAISFTTLHVWAAFQTGNSLQLSLALSRLTALPNEIPAHSNRISYAFTTADWVAIASLAFFNLGAFGGSHLFNTKSDRQTRGWMMLSSFIQTLLTIVASLLDLHPRGEDGSIKMRRYISLVLVAVSLGMQGIQAKKLGTSQFGTSLVLTTAWVDMMNGPFWVPHFRDSKALPIISLILGGFSGGFILRYTGVSIALGLVALLRASMVIGWLLVPAVSDL
ncbi:hypothetical protein L218DRAFT_904932 [Marasmius fiardii PR-910]|nr:hypothetical protein L218DRAFT_904932 [Marasmius fiardii PR-910]